MTRLHLTLLGETGKHQYYDVQEDFEQVINQVFPVNQPASSLEQRTNFLYFKEDGGQVMIASNLVGVVEQIVDDAE